MSSDEIQWFIDNDQIILIGSAEGSESIRSGLRLQGAGDPIDVRRLAERGASAVGLGFEAASLLAEKSGRVWVLTEESWKLFQSKIPSMSANGFHYGSVKNVSGQVVNHLKFHVGDHTKWLNPKLLGGVGGIVSEIMAYHQNEEILRTLHELTESVQDLDRRFDEQWIGRIFSANEEATSARRELDDEGALTEDTWKELAEHKNPLNQLRQEVEQRIATYTSKLGAAKTVAKVEEILEAIAARIHLWAFLLISAHALLVEIEAFHQGRNISGDIDSVIRARNRLVDKRGSRLSGIEATLSTLTAAVARSLDLSSGQIVRNSWKTPRLVEASRRIDAQVTQVYDILQLPKDPCSEPVDIDRRAAMGAVVSKLGRGTKGVALKTLNNPHLHYAIVNGTIQVVRGLK